MKKLLLLAFFLLPFTTHAAIAFDNSNSVQSTGSSASLSLAVAGANRILLAIVATTANVSGSPTYNGTSATQVGSSFVVHTTHVSCWVLVAPSTGTNNFTANFSASSDYFIAIESLTGAAQSGQPDNHQETQSTGNQNTASDVLSSNADNSWHVAGIYEEGGSLTTTVGTSRQAGSQIGISDSNGAIHPAGSNTITWTFGTSPWGLCGFTVAPFVAPTVVPNFGTLTFFGWF